MELTSVDYARNVKHIKTYDTNPCKKCVIESHRYTIWWRSSNHGWIPIFFSLFVFCHDDSSVFTHMNPLTLFWNARWIFEVDCDSIVSWNVNSYVLCWRQSNQNPFVIHRTLCTECIFTSIFWYLWHQTLILLALSLSLANWVSEWVRKVP